MSSFDPSSPSPSRSRRRLAAWAAFGVAGLATGAVWASGFITATGANDSTLESPALTKTAPGAPTNALANKVTKVADLAFDWEGRWGLISGDITMFKVDLAGADFAGKTYNVAVLLSNDSTFGGWATMQLKIERDAVGSAATDCSTADFDGTFLRSSEDTPPTTFPTFIATLDRAT